MVGLLFVVFRLCFCLEEGRWGLLAVRADLGVELWVLEGAVAAGDLA